MAVSQRVTEFKAKCLAMLEDIGQHGGTITITKRGKPLATVKPARQPRWRSEGIWAGKVTITEDLTKVDTSGLWECVTNPERFN
jgi:antitoxin (DNA-binding transcriptional repressor) of toxin-antitoxin stability system